MRSEKALTEFVEACRPGMRVLDIGAGHGEHAEYMRASGLQVITLDHQPPADIVGDFMSVDLPAVDAVWASHVFEHTLNPLLFLQRVLSAVAEGGLICITVPPLKPNLVGGHVNLFTPSLLCYRIILAGQDLSEANIIVDGYNISAIWKKRSVNLPELKMDNGDIEQLSHLFPYPVWQNYCDYGHEQ